MTQLSTQIMAHPNPFLSCITLEIETANPGSSIVYLFDADGKIVKMLSWQLKKGMNITRLNDLDKLINGIYFLDVIDELGQVMHSLKVIKE
jgi:hypothetical protein